jgi:hypothetical protein
MSATPVESETTAREPTQLYAMSDGVEDYLERR